MLLNLKEQKTTQPTPTCLPLSRTYPLLNEPVTVFSESAEGVFFFSDSHDDRADEKPHHPTREHGTETDEGKWDDPGHDQPDHHLYGEGTNTTPDPFFGIFNLSLFISPLKILWRFKKKT